MSTIVAVAADLYLPQFENRAQSYIQEAHSYHKRNLAINTGGGGANSPWILGTLFYKGVKFERGGNWSHKTQVFHFLFSFYFLYAIIQFSNQINYS
jgi:hypothetical protein